MTARATRSESEGRTARSLARSTPGSGARVSNASSGVRLPRNSRHRPERHGTKFIPNPTSPSAFREREAAGPTASTGRAGVEQDDRIGFGDRVFYLLSVVGNEPRSLSPGRLRHASQRRSKRL